MATRVKETQEVSCSVIIPCYNEELNIKECIERVPELGKQTEIIVVDDGSTDNTAKIVRDVCDIGDKSVNLISYTKNKGKGVATRIGFDHASGDILMILDADMTVPPEELVLFFNLLTKTKAEFANGTRMVYPLEGQAMKTLHIIGNKIFSKIFTWLLSQHITDTLCGTKALFKTDYNKIKMNNGSWPDFDLLFGGAELGLRIIEVPVHYKERLRGESKMRTFKHGLLLLKMCLWGFIRLKIKNPRRLHNLH